MHYVIIDTSFAVPVLRVGDQHLVRTHPSRTYRMDDALVLNLALEEGPSTRRLSARKSGRWTDRCVGCNLGMMDRAYYI